MSKGSTSTKKSNGETEDTTILEAEAAGAAAMSSVGFGDLDKVRNILFGAQSREYEKRFSSLEELMRRELDTLSGTVERRLDALESFMKEEYEAFSKRVAAEQQQRTSADERLSEKVQDLSQSVKEGYARLEEQANENERALRARILSQSKELSAEMEQGFRRLTEQIEQAVSALQDEKTDRLGLADLFDELSARLRNNLQLPDQD